MTGQSLTPLLDTVDVLVGGSATYIATATLAANTTGTLDNTASVAVPGGFTDPTPGNDSATDSDTLTPEADVSVSKSDSADPVDAGSALTYTIGVLNNGPSDADAVTVVDTLPAGVTFVSSTPGASKPDSGPQSSPSARAAIMR